MNKKLILICCILLLGSMLVGCRATGISKSDNSTPTPPISSLNESNTPTPPVTTQADAGKTEDSALEYKDIVIYSLPDDIFNLPVDQIPYYSAGDITFLPQSLFDSFSNGHQPWLGNYISVVKVQCKNLIGDSIIYDALINSLSSATTNEYPVIDTAEQFQLSNGLYIKLIQETDGIYVVQMTVPDLGDYKVTLESPLNDGILYIRKITFCPANRSNG
ncbi:MAG: hypothetical protein QM644_19115 [Mobilitalea sp.]